MSEIRTPAVVLATRPLGDADLLVVLLTPDTGKVRAAARSARKSRRRFAGGLPGGALGEATLRPGRSLWRLEQFTSIHDLGVLGRDLDRFAYVAYVCEVTDALVVEPEPDPERFVVLASTVAVILKAAPRPSVLRRFELRLLATLGLLPSLDECCVCGEPVFDAQPPPDPVPFDPVRGGVLCDRHRAAATGVDRRVIELARELTAPAQTDDEAATILEALDQAEPEVRRALRDLAAGLVRGHLRRPLRSLEFLAQIGSPKATS